MSRSSLRSLPTASPVIRSARAADLPDISGWPQTHLPMLIGVVAILLFAGIFGVWGAVAPLASAAIAPGIIKAEGNRRTVQHLEGGILREILVVIGSRRGRCWRASTTWPVRLSTRP